MQHLALALILLFAVTAAVERQRALHHSAAKPLPIGSGSVWWYRTGQYVDVVTPLGGHSMPVVGFNGFEMD